MPMIWTNINAAGSANGLFDIRHGVAVKVRAEGHQGVVKYEVRLSCISAIKTMNTQ